ncbi:hypothetical protein Tco_0344285 [Tanacetum coccineum]
MPLGGHFKLSLMYGTNRGNHVNVTGFVDLDYAKDPDKEAEYMALTEAVKESIWLRGLLEEWGVELNTVAVNCDNQGAIHLSRNHVFHERTKHINVRYHFIREVLEAKTVKVLKVGIEHNDADALTKVDTSRFQSVARYFMMTGRNFIFTKLMILKIDMHRDIVSQSPLGSSYHLQVVPILCVKALNKPSVHREKGISIDEINQFYKSILFAWNCQDYGRAIGEGMPFSNYFRVFMGKIINVTCEWCIDGPVNQDASNKICDGMINSSKCVAREYKNMLMVNVVVPTTKMAPPPKKTVKPGWEKIECELGNMRPSESTKVNQIKLMGVGGHLEEIVYPDKYALVSCSMHKKWEFSN